MLLISFIKNHNYAFDGPFKHVSNKMWNLSFLESETIWDFSIINAEIMAVV